VERNGRLFYRAAPRVDKALVRWHRCWRYLALATRPSPSAHSRDTSRSIVIEEQPRRAAVLKVKESSSRARALAAF